MTAPFALRLCYKLFGSAVVHSNSQLRTPEIFEVQPPSM